VFIRTDFWVNSSVILASFLAFVYTHTHSYTEWKSLLGIFLLVAEWRTHLLKKGHTVLLIFSVCSSLADPFSTFLHSALCTKKLTWFTPKRIVFMPSGFHFHFQWTIPERDWREGGNDVSKLLLQLCLCEVLQNYCVWTKSYYSSQSKLLY
jgi:hypothetical protein